MKGVGIAAVLIAVLAAGTGVWLYRGSIERDIADIKLAPIQCERVFDLRSNAVAYTLKGGELEALWQHCQRIADVASGLDRIERQSLP